MAELIFPSSPAAGDLFPDPALPGVSQWIWDGSRWNLVPSGACVTVSNTPPGNGRQGDLWFDAENLKLFVWYNDEWVVANPSGGEAIGDNRVINGDMRIDARHNGASGIGVVYTVDRWNFGNVFGHGTWGRNIGSLASAPGFPYYLGFSTSGAYTPAAGEAFQFNQPIEADMISDFQWGTANAQPVTVSFWAFANIAGAFSGSLSNYAATRSYPFNFSLAVSTWTKFVVTIPGDTGGTWVMSGNGGGAVLHFDLGSGANVRGPANAWSSSGLVGVTGAASVLTAANQYLLLTGVKLEIGSVATPFNRQSLVKSIADCQRYYTVLTNIWQGGIGTAGGQIMQAMTLPVTMRAIPTANTANVAYTNASGLSIGPITATNFSSQAGTLGTGNCNMRYDVSFDAEL